MITKSFEEKMMKDVRFEYLFPKNKNNKSKTRRMKLSAIPKFIEFGNEVLDKSSSNLGDPP